MCGAGTAGLAYGEYPTRDAWIRYLEDYAAHHRIDVRFGTQVRRLEPAEEEWRLETDGEGLRARFVVIATGFDHDPELPDWPGRDSFNGGLLHSSAYRNPEPYRGRDVLVVGPGTTGSPSMDKQEMYVATSRTREQTYLYATQEIQADRSEYAPTGPKRDPNAHVGEAAERDRAQIAAHDAALRAELAELPTTELAARRGKLDTPARFEARHQEDYARQVQAVEERRGQVEQASANREAVEAGREVRREREIAAQLLDARSAQALTAARIEPPSYIVKELGERPTDPIKARSWDHGVQGVERYRLKHGVRDKSIS